MTESETLQNRVLQIKASLLIEFLDKIFNLDRKGDLKDLLFIAYGLSEKESELLISSSKGNISEKTSEIIEKALKELDKFLSVKGEILVLRIFSASLIDERKKS